MSISLKTGSNSLQGLNFVYVFLLSIYFLRYSSNVVKTRKEAERMGKMDAIAAQKARVEELRRSVQEQRANRDEYAAIISQQFLGTSLSSCCLIRTLFMNFAASC